MTDQPTHTDVLLGRGVATTRHPGNKNFRFIVSQHCTVYATSTKKQKMMISRSVVDKIHTELQPPGRFLEKDATTGLWREVDDRRALEKAAQALRDGAAPLRKGLVEEFVDPNFLDTLFEDNSKKNPQDSASEKKGKKKHRRTKSDPSKAKNVLFPRKKQRIVLDVERSSSAPIVAEADKLRMADAEQRELLASYQQQKSAEQRHLAQVAQQPLPPQGVLSSSYEQSVLSSTSIINTMVNNEPQADVTFSNALTLGLLDDYAPLPMMEGEAVEAAISLDDILQVVAILSDAGILSPGPTTSASAIAKDSGIPSPGLGTASIMGDTWR